MIAGIPQCPTAPLFSQLNLSPNDEVAQIIKVKNEAQQWLSNVLLFPGARESPAVQQFLCYGANTVPPQYQGVNWITTNNASANQRSGTYENSGTNNGTNGADFEMEESMFFGCHDDHHDSEGEVDDEDDDYDPDYFSPTQRYQPTVEEVTQDDMLDLQNNADDVEMIEDVGSFAQSMGASHLGRSLQLQAEMSNYKKNTSTLPQDKREGINIGSKLSKTSPGVSNGGGGIGNAVANAGIDGLSDSFYQKAPVSAPRLDSFKMIKVVGKGSFGKFHNYFRHFFFQNKCLTAI